MNQEFDMGPETERDEGEGQIRRRACEDGEQKHGNTRRSSAVLGGINVSPAFFFYSTTSVGSSLRDFTIFSKEMGRNPPF